MKKIEYLSIDYELIITRMIKTKLTTIWKPMPWARASMTHINEEGGLFAYTGQCSLCSDSLVQYGKVVRKRRKKRGFLFINKIVILCVWGLYAINKWLESKINFHFLNHSRYSEYWIIE